MQNRNHNEIVVTIIVATFNRAEYLAQALDSVLSQTRAPDEVIVIDDGSTDTTSDVAARYENRIRYFRRENRGKAAALNFAIPRATGTHVCIFDDDDVMLPDALRSHVDFLQSNPDIDYSYSPNLVFDDHDRTIDIWDEAAWRSGDTIECPPEELFVRTMEWNGAFLQSMLIPTRCLLAVGLFSETLLRTQDYDVMLRLARRYRGASMGRASFVWRNHSGARGPAAERHEDHDRYTVFHRYEQKVFRALREDVSLIEYLPRVPNSASAPDSLAPGRRAEALLKRSQIMFGRGLFAEGAEDIRLLLRESELDASQLQRVVELVKKTANIGERDYIADAPQLARGLRLARVGAGGKAIVNAAIKGFYWSLATRLRTQGVRQFWQLGFALATLMAHRAKTLI